MLHVRPLHTLLCALLFSLPAAAQDEVRVLATFTKAFAPAAKGKAGADVATKRTALQGTDGLDTAKTAETLVAGWQHVATEIGEIDTTRAAGGVEIAELIKGQEAAKTRTLPQEKLDRLKELQQEMATLGDRAEALRKLHLEVGDRLAELRRRDSVLWLLQRVFGQKKFPLPLKLACARAIGGGASEILVELAAALQRTKDPGEQIALLDAMALAGSPAQPHASPVIALLQSGEEVVAERAALALAKLAVPEAIEPMIALLGRTDGQMRLRVAAALEVLTGQQFGSNTGAWQAWWKGDGKAFVAGGSTLGKGTPSHRKETDKFYYFGIPQNESSAILYVIDCSGSMTAPVKTQNDATAGAGSPPAEQSRLEACKTELTRALGLLRADQKFAVLWYNDQPHWWEPAMQLATKDAVARAQAFVKTLSPASSTNIHDTLEKAFSLVGRGAKDKYYGVEVDTVFLLTDGSPTKPDGQLDSTEKILVAARTWNVLKRVTIHCIAIGRDLNEQFLRQLASENGGEFKQF